MNSWQTVQNSKWIIQNSEWTVKINQLLKVLEVLISPKLIKFNHKYYYDFYVDIILMVNYPFVSCTLSQVIHKIYILIKAYYISMQVWLQKYLLRSMVIFKMTTQTR